MGKRIREIAKQFEMSNEELLKLLREDRKICGLLVGIGIKNANSSIDSITAEAVENEISSRKYVSKPKDAPEEKAEGQTGKKDITIPSKDISEKNQTCKSEEPQLATVRDLAMIAATLSNGNLEQDTGALVTKAQQIWNECRSRLEYSEIKELPYELFVEDRNIFAGWLLKNPHRGSKFIEEVTVQGIILQEKLFGSYSETKRKEELEKLMQFAETDYNGKEDDNSFIEQLEKNEISIEGKENEIFIFPGADKIRKCPDTKGYLFSIFETRMLVEAKPAYISKIRSKAGKKSSALRKRKKLK